MNELFSFEVSPWEAALQSLKSGGSIRAVRFLTLLDAEDEDVVEEALQELEERKIALDLTDLPVEKPEGKLAQRLEREGKLAKREDLISALEEEDPLRLYLEEVAATPAAGDPVLLADMAAQGDEAARNMLVNVSLHRVISLARELTGKGVLLLDLIQEGSLGLWQSILSWNGEGEFEAHRDWWIRQSMAKLITLQARSAGTGSKVRKALEAYRQADKALLTRLGRNPSVEEIALEMNISAEDARLLEKMLSDARSSEKVKKAQEVPEEDPEDLQHVEDTAYFQMRQRIQELLSVLPQQDAQILTLRFGLEGGLPLDARQTAARLGLTPEEVTEREMNALAKLRSET